MLYRRGVFLVVVAVDAVVDGRPLGVGGHLDASVRLALTADGLADGHIDAGSLGSLVGTLLRTKHISSTITAIQRIAHIAYYSHVHLTGKTVHQIGYFLHSLQHTPAAITRGAASDTNHQMLASACQRIGNHLADAVSCRQQRVALSLGNQCQTACRRHLHISRFRLGRHSIYCLDGAHQWVVDLGYNILQRHKLREALHQTFATVTQGH